MSREIRHDGSGAFEIRFPFDRSLVDRIKALPNRRWNAGERFWSVPERDVVALVDLLEPHGFRFDSATRDAYVSSGGTRSLGEGTVASEKPPSLPGLFDDADDDDALPAATEDYTVSGLNEQVRLVIEGAFPQPVWLVGEISGFNRGAHKKHVGFQLVEKDDGGATLSEINVTLFDRTRREIASALKRAGEPFRMEDEIRVRLRVRVGLYVPWGSYRVVVEELDVGYTLGEAARRREEIVRRLGEQGLLGVNSALPMPALPLRVGLVTSLGSDAYNDVLRTLQESGFAFRLVAHGARVQGHATEPSVLNALDAFAERIDDLDVVLVCRGGGSRTDLAWFDSEALGRALARFPLPVIVGIGHEQDRSVLDEVGRRAKTPTAAARWLVDTVQRSLDELENHAAALLARAGRQLAEERQRHTDRGKRLGLAARSLLEREMVRLAHRRERACRASRTRLASAREWVGRLMQSIPRAGSVLLTRQQTLVDQLQGAVTQAARRRTEREAERNDARDRRLQLVDPRRVVERGYSILRLADGGVLTDARNAPHGAAVTAELKRGTLRLRSEGTPEIGGGD